MARRLTIEHAAAELDLLPAHVASLIESAFSVPDLGRCCTLAGIDPGPHRAGAAAALAELRSAVAGFRARAESRDLGPAVRPVVAALQSGERWVASLAVHLANQQGAAPQEVARSCAAAADVLRVVLDRMQQVRISVAEIW